MKAILVIKIVAFGLLFSFTSVYSQGITNKWVLGYYGGGGNIIMNFKNDSLHISNSVWKMNFDDLNASICDSHGNFLFYTNGGWIANANNDTMQNGNDLAPGTYASQWKGNGFRIVQGGLIIPFPYDSSKFYLFHETVYFDSFSNIIPCQNLLYSTIDMSLDSALGGVVIKNAVVLNDSLIYGELTACKHANGRDWWIFTHQRNTDLFFKFLITPAGITGPFIQNIGSIQTQAWPGQTCISPDGKKYARYTPNDDLDIYDFDRCSGLLSNPVHIQINDTAYAGGVAFSPNSRYLYVSSYRYVYQFDVTNSNIELTKDTVAIFDGFVSPSFPFYTRFYLSLLAPDGKIYINTTNSTQHMHVINSPDSAGSACNLVQHGIFLNVYNSFSIPNHPNYFLRADSGSVCDTLMLSTNSSQAKLDVSSISVYPNPAKEILFINHKNPSRQTEQFILYNSLGEVVLRKNLSPSTKASIVAIDNLQSGIYFWKFIKQTGKLLINNE
jgi:Secretion system C-terminal sorting domain